MNIDNIICSIQEQQDKNLENKSLKFFLENSKENENYIFFLNELEEIKEDYQVLFWYTNIFPCSINRDNLMEWFKKNFKIYNNRLCIDYFLELVNPMIEKIWKYQTEYKEGIKKSLISQILQ